MITCLAVSEERSISDREMSMVENVAVIIKINQPD